MTSYNPNDITFNQCCRLGDFCKYAYAGWTCTEAYNNTLYAKYACPYNTLMCGVNDTYTITTLG